ncbi:uncharacterized protein LOC118754222 [Rhagoletis pomonella]|uniref:uncharacterized protein LOC118754222 n=1 Tax=Rhagoletis pomonella TaxID=28610 RepID=UPI001784E1C0|nr:uncharacterized protein LOC118754222 [Rhagoletis pomonella]
MRRFVNNCCKAPGNRLFGTLNVQELREAELLVIRSTQQSTYVEEYALLNDGNQICSSSRIFKLNPVVDDAGIMRLNGRLQNADAVHPYTRRPAVMPQGHHVTNTLVDLYHRVWKHQSENTIVSELRRKYWIPHIREEVRKAAKRCLECKRRRARPDVPQMGQLPADRLTPFVRPFTYVGLDYMDPFLIVSGRRTEKRWIALFTCLTTRVIHHEIAIDLTTDTCLLCIKNFMCRRGTPVRIRSDNGTNFIGADREMQRQLKDFEEGTIPDALANQNIEWVFNCPLSPQAGGCWERLVRSVKRAMKHALNSERLKEQTLYSVMCEAENVVNSRPLMHIPLDAPDEEPLTPNHFLLGTANSEQTPHPQEESFKATRTQWRKMQQIQHRFWKRWLAEYLPDLCRRTKWWKPVEPLSLGDLVLVCDDRMHRSRWLIVRVVSVKPGKDGQVRVAEVKTAGGHSGDLLVCWRS